MTSLFSKETNTEHLWQANPDVWEWHAPNLFPVVGGCINNQVIIPAGCPRTAEQLGRWGFTAHQIELDEFIKAGGACKCLVLRL